LDGVSNDGQINVIEALFEIYILVFVTGSYRKNAPNKVCSGQMEFCSIIEYFSGFEFFLFPCGIHVRPTTSIENCWVAHPETTFVFVEMEITR